MFKKVRKKIIFCLKKFKFVFSTYDLYLHIKWTFERQFSNTTREKKIKLFLEHRPRNYYAHNLNITHAPRFFVQQSIYSIKKKKTESKTRKFTQIKMKKTRPNDVFKLRAKLNLSK